MSAHLIDYVVWPLATIGGALMVYVPLMVAITSVRRWGNRHGRR